jgi:hypothetical protein
MSPKSLKDAQESSDVNQPHLRYRFAASDDVATCDEEPVQESFFQKVPMLGIV